MATNSAATAGPTSVVNVDAIYNHDPNIQYRLFPKKPSRFSRLLRPSVIALKAVAVLTIVSLIGLYGFLTYPLVTQGEGVVSGIQAGFGKTVETIQDGGSWLYRQITGQDPFAIAESQPYAVGPVTIEYMVCWKSKPGVATLDGYLHIANPTASMVGVQVAGQTAAIPPHSAQFIDLALPINQGCATDLVITDTPAVTTTVEGQIAIIPIEAGERIMYNLIKHLSKGDVRSIRNYSGPNLDTEFYAVAAAAHIMRLSVISIDPKLCGPLFEESHKPYTMYPTPTAWECSFHVVYESSFPMAGFRGSGTLEITVSRQAGQKATLLTSGWVAEFRQQ